MYWGMPRLSIAPESPALWFPIALVVAAFAVQARPATASACSCAPPEGPTASLAASTAVFEGRVESITPGELIQVRFAVTRAWKGAEEEQVEVRTRAHGAACGYRFAEGATYLVYAYGEPDDLRVGLCSRTRPIEDASDDLAELGAGITPVDPNGPPEFEPYQEDEEPPARGGCASCSAPGSRAEPHWLGAVLCVCLLGATLRRGTRR